jgi:hypothetical protein
MKPHEWGTRAGGAPCHCPLEYFAITVTVQGSDRGPRSVVILIAEQAVGKELLDLFGGHV